MSSRSAPPRGARPRLVLLRGGRDEASADWSAFCDRIGWGRADAALDDDALARLRERLAATTGGDPTPVAAVACASPPLAPSAEVEPRGRRGAARRALLVLGWAAAVAAAWAAGAAGVGRAPHDARDSRPASLDAVAPATLVAPSSAPLPSAREPREPVEPVPPSHPPALPSDAPPVRPPGVAVRRSAAPAPGPRLAARALEPSARSVEPPRDEPARDALAQLAPASTAPHELVADVAASEPRLTLATLGSDARAPSFLVPEPSPAAWLDGPSAVTAPVAEPSASWSLSASSRRVYGASLSPSLQPEGLPSVGVMAQLDVGRALAGL